jgi:NADPH:quinone reductase-like Zn-dependent oxidoreductase
VARGVLVGIVAPDELGLPLTDGDAAMKVYELSAFGIDNLTLVERPDPKPGPGQVLLRVKALSLNYRDLLVVKGLYNPRMRLPAVPFSDGAGEVAAVGDGVTRVKVGDRAAICMQKWLDGGPDEAKAKSSLGGGAEGMLAEMVVLHEDGVVHPGPPDRRGGGHALLPSRPGTRAE